MAGRNSTRRTSGGSLTAELTSVRFAALARRLGEATRKIGVPSPGFRSPPRRPGCRRTIRWEADGSATISVALRGRPAIAVVSDMVDGVLVACRLDGPKASATRDELWAAVAQLIEGESDDRPGSLPGRSAA